MDLDKNPEYFRELAKKKKLVKYGESLSWLKSDIEPGYGHANATRASPLDKRKSSSFRICGYASPLTSSASSTLHIPNVLYKRKRCGPDGRRTRGGSAPGFSEVPASNATIR